MKMNNNTDSKATLQLNRILTGIQARKIGDDTENKGTSRLT